MRRVSFDIQWNKRMYSCWMDLFVGQGWQIIVPTYFLFFGFAVEQKISPSQEDDSDWFCSRLVRCWMVGE